MRMEFCEGGWDGSARTSVRGWDGSGRHHEAGANGLGGSSREVVMGQNRGEDLHAG